MTITGLPNSATAERIEELRALLRTLSPPFSPGDKIGIKLHWGERGNTSFLPPQYAREIVRWLKDLGIRPFVFDTTVLYSGGRRNGRDSLQTAAMHGYTPEYLGCPVVIGDGLDGMVVMDIPSGFRHFDTVQVGRVLEWANGFVVFSHFKGHLVAGFGGAIKNISMGFASRAQKQRMHADVQPQLIEEKCIKCGICAQVCPVGAVEFSPGNYPKFNLDRCIGCAQCIGSCPEVAIKVQWNADKFIFQERLVETAAAVWRIIAGKTVLINAAVHISRDCDCMPGENPVIGKDVGFFAGYHPVDLDWKTLQAVGEDIFRKAHPNVPFIRQFSFAEEIGFVEEHLS